MKTPDARDDRSSSSDEAGVSERLTRVWTWARESETPVVQFHFNWHQLSLIAGMHFNGVCFRLHDDTIAKLRSAQRRSVTIASCWQQAELF